MDFLFEKESKLLPKEETEYKNANDNIIKTMKNYKTKFNKIVGENEKLNGDIKKLEEQIENEVFNQKKLIKSIDGLKNWDNPDKTNNLENTNKNHEYLKSIYDEILKNIIVPINKAEYKIKVNYNNKFNMILFEKGNRKEDFTIKDLKFKIKPLYNVKLEFIVLTDENNHILHDDWKLFNLFYPFEKFYFKDRYPEIYLKFIFNLTHNEIVTKMENLMQSIKNDEINQENENKERLEKKIKNNKDNKEIKKIEKNKTQSKKKLNLKKKLYEYSKKFGKLVQTTLLIIFYILIFNKNTYARKGLQNLSIIEDYVTGLKQKSKIKNSLDVLNFTNLLYDEFRETSWYINNQYLKYGAVFQKRNDLKTCEIPDYLKENYNFTTNTCINEDFENIQTFGSDYKYEVYNSAEFSSYGRNFGNLNGYYLLYDLKDYENSKKNLINKMSNNWLDLQTQFIGYIFNFYDAQDKLAFNFVIYYDLKFKDFLLSNIYLNYTLFSLNTLSLIDYFFLALLLIFNIINFILTLKEIIKIENKDSKTVKKAKINQIKIEKNRFTKFNKTFIIYQINFFQIISKLISFY